jgi:hypothetical protein
VLGVERRFCVPGDDVERHPPERLRDPALEPFGLMAQ